MVNMENAPQNRLIYIDLPSGQWPSIHGELELSHDYADEQKFSDDNITERLAHYANIEHEGDLTKRALGDVAVICSRLWFEFDQRERERRDLRVAAS